MWSFQSMNTEVTVSSSGDEQAIAQRVLEIFTAAEARFSRFREDSELSQLNRARGPFRASPELFELLVRARAYVELTEGLFDPAVGSAVVALGYDRSFCASGFDRDAVGERPPSASLLEVTLEDAPRTVTRPPHIHIDLGGLAKGATVDRAAAVLGAHGAIDAGGDAYVRAADGARWLIEVEDPRAPTQTAVVVAVSSSAMATSASNRRRWRAGGQWVHHLIDPRTQRSASEELLQATVFAPTTELAEVLAKAAFLLGPGAAPAFLQRRPGVAAVLLPRRGGPIFVGQLEVLGVSYA